MHEAPLRYDYMIYARAGSFGRGFGQVGLSMVDPLAVKVLGPQGGVAHHQAARGADARAQSDPYGSRDPRDTLKQRRGDGSVYSVHVMVLNREMQIIN